MSDLIDRGSPVERAKRAGRLRVAISRDKDGVERFWVVSFGEKFADFATREEAEDLIKHCSERE